MADKLEKALSAATPALVRALDSAGNSINSDLITLASAMPVATENRNGMMRPCERIAYSNISAIGYVAFAKTETQCSGAVIVTVGNQDGPNIYDAYLVWIQVSLTAYVKVYVKNLMGRNGVTFYYKQDDTGALTLVAKTDYQWMHVACTSLNPYITPINEVLDGSDGLTQVT